MPGGESLSLPPGTGTLPGRAAADRLGCLRHAACLCYNAISVRGRTVEVVLGFSCPHGASLSFSFAISHLKEVVFK